MVQTVKASQQPPEVWDQRLFLHLFRRLFIETTTVSHAEMNHDAQQGTMPPEFKKRPPHQGAQRKFRRRLKNGRAITVLTSFSKIGNRKKEAYFGWVILSGKGVKTKGGKFFSGPVYDYDSFFETMLGWVDAFIDIAEHWPIKDGMEYDMVHIPGILHMTQFVHTKRNGPQVTTTSFPLLECKTLTKKTVSFLKRKMGKSYEKQKEMMVTGEKPKRTPRRVKSSKRREQAIVAAKRT